MMVLLQREAVERLVASSLLAKVLESQFQRTINEIAITVNDEKCLKRSR